MTDKPSDVTHAPSATPFGSTSSFTIVLSQYYEYDRLRQLEFSQNGHSTTHAFSSV